MFALPGFISTFMQNQINFEPQARNYKISKILYTSNGRKGLQNLNYISECVYFYA